MYEYKVIDGVKDGVEALFALLQCQLRLLELRDVHHCRDQARYFPRFGTERKEIREPMTLDSGRCGSRSVKLGVQDWHAALVDRPVKLHDPVGEVGDDLAQSATDMRADGQSVDVRHVFVDPHVAIVGIHETETNWRIPVDLLDFVENALALGDGGLQFAIRGGLVESQSQVLYDRAVDVAPHQRDDHDVSRQHQAHRNRDSVALCQITNYLWNGGGQRETEKGGQICRLLERRADRHAAEHERDDDLSEWIRRHENNRPAEAPKDTGHGGANGKTPGPSNLMPALALLPQIACPIDVARANNNAEQSDPK
ncbi:MAG: hypothetical protein WBF03_17620 [Xanthobacteraceae bacterium]